MDLKPGYIQVYVMGTDSCILDSHGFCFDDLVSIDKQIKEPEEFENVEEGIYTFAPKYCTAEKDYMYRITVPEYWEFEEDEYCEYVNECVKAELEAYENADYWENDYQELLEEQKLDRFQ